jgi:hypothetical protein
MAFAWGLVVSFLSKVTPSSWSLFEQVVIICT